MANQKVMVQDAAADTDALSGTDLERAPGPGILQVWAASTVNTATITLAVGGANVLRGQVVPLRTNGVPNMNEDPPMVAMEVFGGEKIAVNLGGTTGTIHTVAEFTPAEDL